MERIVLEVDERIANAWRRVSSQKRLELTNKLNIRLGRELLEYSGEDFLLYLNQLREKMSMRGLTQEELDKILNEED